MAVAPDDLLALANQLSEYNQEASWRCAVSRAYYAAYHKCRLVGNTLPEPPYDSKPQGSHDTLIKKFTTQRNLKLKSIGFLLKEARDLRMKADYDIDESFGQLEVKDAFDLVNKIDAKLQLINDSAKTE